MFIYNKLWKKLIDRNMSKLQLRQELGLSSKVITRMGKNEYVSLATLDLICNYFNCDIGDIIEHKK